MFYNAALSMEVAAMEFKVGDVVRVSRRLGHVSIRITLDVYGHLMPGMQDQAAGAVERQLGRG